jgi:cell division protein FtsQ
MTRNVRTYLSKRSIGTIGRLKGWLKSRRGRPNRRVGKSARSSANRRKQETRQPLSVRLKSLWPSSKAMVEATGRRVYRVSPYVLIALIGAALPVAAMYGYQYITQTPSFSVRQVEVDGNKRVTVAELLETAGVAQGPNVLALDIDEVEARLRAHPWVVSAKVKRELPDRLRITIREHVPTALVSVGALYLVDSKGEVFKRVEVTDNFDLPVLTGLTHDDLDPATDPMKQRRAQTLIRRALSLLDAWNRSPIGKTVTINEVRLDPLFGYSVVLGRGHSAGVGAVVHLGHGDIKPKLGKLAILLDDALRREKQIAEIYLDDVRNPGRVTVRFRKSPEAREQTNDVKTKASGDEIRRREGSGRAESRIARLKDNP